MRFWRPRANRRIERSEVLDVKMRSEPVRKARHQLVGLALLLSALAVVAVLLALRGGDWARQQLLDSRLFALTTIEITTDGVWLKPDQIRQWLGVQEGDNLLLVDMPRIRRDLELIPQVESAAVERVLPHLLRIHVTERDPVLQVQAIQAEGANGLAPAIFYLDRAAVVMPPLPPTRSSSAWAQAFDALPVLRGISSAELRPGQAVHSRPVDATLGLLAAFEQSPLANQMDLKSIDIASPAVIRLTTGQGAEITLPPDQLDQALRRWLLIHQAGQKMAKAVASADLSITNNCPVLWLEASLLPPPKAKPPKPPRFRRNHV